MGKRGDFFDFYLKLSKIYFLARPDVMPYPTLYRIITPPVIMFMCTPFIMEVLQILKGDTMEFSDELLTLGLLFMHSVGIFRLLGFLPRKQDYEDVITFIRRPSFNFNIFKYSNLSMLIANDEKTLLTRHPIEELKDSTYKTMDNFCTKTLLFFINYVHLNALISYTQSCFNPTYEKFNPRVNRTSIYRDYVYLLWYPFDISMSDGYYWWGFFYQPFCFCLLMNAFLCIYILNAAFILYLKGQANILACVVSHVDKNIDETMRYGEIMKLKEIRIIKCVNELQAVYKCSSMVNDISTYPMLMQIFFSTVMCCGMMYRVESVNTLGEYFYLCSTVGVCWTLLFLMCWYHQEVTLSIMDIELKINELDWVNYPERLRKTVMFTITRLQKPFYFTMGNWTPINSGTFIGMVKMCYSSYMLVKTTTQKEEQ